MSERGVLFFNAGAKHGVHLIVAVISLRNHYGGQVAICCEENGPGRAVAEALAADALLGPIKVIPDKTLRAGGKGVSYQSKTLLPRVSPFDSTIFLDADTLVLGDISPLWPDQATGEVKLTQFSNWVSTGPKLRGRIAAWAPFGEKRRVERMFEKPWPAINTGVMAWSRTSEAFCEEWHHTAAKRNTFIVDETAAQIIFPDFNVTVLDCRYNASVKYDWNRKGFDPLSAVVAHGHGGKFWKCDAGRALYLPHYELALSQNRAGIQTLSLPGAWWNSLPDSDKALLSCYKTNPKSACQPESNSV